MALTVESTLVDGVYQLDKGALLNDFFCFFQELEVGDWLGHVQAAAVQHQMVLYVQYLLAFPV